MHSSVIDEILEVEDKAYSIIENAEKEARDILLNAQSDKKKFVQSQIDTKRKINEAQLDESEKLLKDHLAAYEERKTALEKEEADYDYSMLERASARIVGLLIGEK